MCCPCHQEPRRFIQTSDGLIQGTQAQPSGDDFLKVADMIEVRRNTPEFQSLASVVDLGAVQRYARALGKALQPKCRR